MLALLAAHDQVGQELLDARRRGLLAERVRRERDDRDGQRFADLDAAVARLVQRFGGLPEDKLAGLRQLAAERGIDADAFALRVRRYKVLPAGTPARPDRPAVDPDLFRQVRADLDELGRLSGETPPTSLLTLLGLPPGAERDEIRQARDEFAARNRERRPDRRRALVDDLLAAVTALLVDADPALYLDALAADVTARLRPAVAAAVLVEDALTPRHYTNFLTEAEEHGLDRGRAEAVLAELAREHGVDVPDVPVRARPTRLARPSQPLRPAQRPQQSRTAPSRATQWLEPLARARAALRAGRPVEAHEQVAEARERAGELLPAIRAVADEVEQVIREAGSRWRQVEAAVSGRNLRTAARLLDELARDAADVPGRDGRSVAEEIATVREQLARADEMVAAAGRSHGAQRESLLLEALEIVADHQAARDALAVTGVAPPTRVRARRAGRAVVVTWQPSPSAGTIRYRVLRIGPDGASRAVGVTQVTSIEDGGVGPDTPIPAYEVLAGRSGLWSAPARSDAAQLASDPVSVVLTAADRLAPATDLHLAGDLLRWTWPPGCTEMMVVWRADAPAHTADDPAAHRRKVTNARYDVDGGVPVPAERPLHLAVFGCVRDGGRLLVASVCPPSARLWAAGG
ncbi:MULTISPECIES: hypothetical protein [Protofrankia]|uniref:Fibronectin type-III domain-containing protein n=1 Tax=Candidatus Protofrankia datiscae TaxID=2716812 RepID=F8B3A5_9ACTN|nr:MULTISPECIES: hypothetical protein [Protofrankia]AEH10907.1 hypothetical protein FsymDg_3628 [Candidatus Protofrankia datiscae]